MVPKVIPLTGTYPQPQESKEICVSHPLLSSHSLSQIPSASSRQLSLALEQRSRCLSVCLSRESVTPEVVPSPQVVSGSDLSLGE